MGKKLTLKFFFTGPKFVLVIDNVQKGLMDK